MYVKLRPKFIVFIVQDSDMIISKETARRAKKILPSPSSG